MRKVLTCLTVVLLLSSLCLTLTPKNAYSKTQDIKVVSYNYIIDNLGMLDVPGEIQNIGTDTIEKVMVKGTVYGADGTEKASSSVAVQAYISHMAPGQKAPFMLEFNKPANSDWYTSGISKITFVITEAEAVNSHLYPNLTVTSSATVSTSGEDKGTYWVSGNVKNIGFSQTVSKLVVSATFYNSSGHVVSVGCTKYLEPDSLSPDATVSFKVGAYFTDQSAETVSSDQKITSYTLNAQAILPVLDGSATPVPDTSPQQNSPTQTETTPTQQNETLSNQNLMYIIIIAGVVIAVVAALLVSRKQKTPPPKPVETKKPHKKR